MTVETLERNNLEPNLYDRFTDGAKRLLILAQEEAVRLNHSDINTLHLLLAAIRLDDPLLKSVFESAGLTLDRARRVAEAIRGKGDKPVERDINLSVRAKKCVELGARAANERGSEGIGPEHLFYGVVDEGEGIAAGVLESLGVNLIKLKATLKQVMTTHELPSATKPPEQVVELTFGQLIDQELANPSFTDARRLVLRLKIKGLFENPSSSLPPL